MNGWRGISTWPFARTCSTANGAAASPPRPKPCAPPRPICRSTCRDVRGSAFARTTRPDSSELEPPDEPNRHRCAIPPVLQKYSVRSCLFARRPRVRRIGIRISGLAPPETQTNTNMKHIITIHLGLLAVTTAFAAGEKTEQFKTRVVASGLHRPTGIAIQGNHTIYFTEVPTPGVSGMRGGSIREPVEPV